MVYVVTRNGADTSVTITASCPNTTVNNAGYSTSGGVSFSPTDRIGVRVHDSGGGVYSSGAMRATVTLKVSP